MRESIVLPSLARTVSGKSDAINTNLGHEISSGVARFIINVTAVAGTSPTLGATIKALVNGVELTVGSFASKTAVGQESVIIEACPNDILIDWVIGGTTPSFTFEVHCVRS